MSYAQPYAGMKIVDLSQAIAASYAASLLAQQGAEVIKVEPHRGDWMRWTGYAVGYYSTLSIIANLGKRSLVVDLKTEEGLEIVCQLIKAISEKGYTPCAMRGLVSPQLTGRGGGFGLRRLGRRFGSARRRTSLVGPWSATAPP